MIWPLDSLMIIAFTIQDTDTNSISFEIMRQLFHFDRFFSCVSFKLKIIFDIPQNNTFNSMIQVVKERLCQYITVTN